MISVIMTKIIAEYCLELPKQFVLANVRLKYHYYSVNNKVSRVSFLHSSLKCLCLKAVGLEIIYEVKCGCFFLIFNCFYLQSG